MKSVSFSFILFFAAIAANAQFAPRAGTMGSTAVYKDSSAIKAWANACTVVRGYKDISSPDSGFAVAGHNELATGAADGSTVSLGDDGTAVVTFTLPVMNGSGPDFVVFENGFQTVTGSDSDFIELAFVEVSSDGVNFFRFPSESLTDTNKQLGTFDGSKAYLYHNLAGKYVGKYGVPFDLEELKGITLLDIDNVTHVKVIDVVGSLNDSFSRRDSKGRKINDPWPTPFDQSGFDLDAVGVINRAPQGISKTNMLSLKIFPNPSRVGEDINIGITEGSTYRLFNLSGILIASGRWNKTIRLEEPGMYIIEVRDGDLLGRARLIIR